MVYHLPIWHEIRHELEIANMKRNSQTSSASSMKVKSPSEEPQEERAPQERRSSQERTSAPT